LYSNTSDRTEESEEELQLLKYLSQRPDLTVEQLLQLAKALSQIDTFKLGKSWIQSTHINDSIVTSWAESKFIQSDNKLETDSLSPLILQPLSYSQEKRELDNKLLAYYVQRSDVTTEHLLELFQK